MKITRFIPLLLSFSLPAWAPAAQAGEPPTIQKIGLVNLGRVFKEYEVTKGSEQELERISTAKQQEREKKVSQIRDLRDELALLNEQAREERRQTIEERLRELAGFDQSVRESLRERRDEALQKILDEIEKVVTVYAKEKGFDLILSDRAVLYGAEPMDVTNEIIAILNRSSGKKP